MTASLIDRVEALLTASLQAWHVEGNVRKTEDSALLVTAGGKQIRISRAPPGLPFRWTVAVDGRSRVAASVASLLRTLRGTLDPAYRPIRLRIAPLPLVQPAIVPS